MIKLSVTGLDETIKNFEAWPRKFNEATVRALNAIGVQVEDEMIRELAHNTQLPRETIVRQFRTWPASLSHMAYNIVADNPMLQGSEDEPSGRAIVGRRNLEFAVSDLMRVTPSHEDEKVCHLCRAVINGSPYTVAELKRILPRMRGQFARVHPNCRCLAVPFRIRSKTQFNIARPGQGWEINEVTIRALVARLQGELDLIVMVR